MLKYLLGTKNGVLGDETVARLRPHEVDWVETPHRQSLTCDDRLIFVCRVPVYIQISCCQQRHGTKKTTWTPRICTHLSTHWLPPTLLGEKIRLEIYIKALPMYSHNCQRPSWRTDRCRHFAHATWQRWRIGTAIWRYRLENRRRKTCSGKNCPHIKVVERDYPSTYAKYTALGTLNGHFG